MRYLQEFSHHVTDLNKVNLHTRIPCVTIYGHGCLKECRLFNVWILKPLGYQIMLFSYD